MWLRTIMCYQQAHGTKMAEVSFEARLSIAPYSTSLIIRRLRTPTSTTTGHPHAVPAGRRAALLPWLRARAHPRPHLALRGHGSQRRYAHHVYYNIRATMHLSWRNKHFPHTTHARRARPLRPVPGRQGGPHHHQDRRRLRRLGRLARGAHAVSLEMHYLSYHDIHHMTHIPHQPSLSNNHRRPPGSTRS